MNQNGFLLRSYAVALVTIAAAVLLRAVLTPFLGAAFPLATMFSAVAFSAWYGGWGPALLTAVLGFIVVDVVFIPGIGVLGGQLVVPELVSITIYLASCGSIIVLGAAMRSAQRRLEAGQRELRSANLALESKVEAQSLLAAIVASSTDAIISKTLEGRITSWNPGAERLFGYTAAEAVGQSIMMLIPPELQDDELVILDRLRRGERIEHLETIRVTRSGQRRHVALTVSTVHDRHGHIIGASKTARDITERKATEEALRRSEEEHRLLVAIHDSTRGLEDPALVMREIVTRIGLHFDVTRCAYGEVDPQLDALIVTQGYTNGVPTVAGRYPLDVFGPLLVGELKAGRTASIDDVRRDPLTDALLAQQTYERMQIVSIICVPLLRSRQLAAVLVMCDSKPRHWSPNDGELLEQVAERTLFAVEGARAAAALRENRDVLKLAMAAGKMGAWSHDLALGATWWSPELATIFGLDPAGTEFSRTRLFDLVAEEDRTRLPLAIQSALEQRQDYSLEFGFRHASSGEWRWMQARGKATFGADGRPQLLYGLGIDVTDHKRAVEALQEADRRKDDFLATLAHELRNPLAPISSGLQILNTPNADPALTVQARDIMERQVAQMVRLVDDLLDVARITTGKVDLRAQPLDLAQAITDAIETARPLITMGGQALTVETPRAPVFVHADRTRLAQVFANLLNNAAKYSDRDQPIAISFAREGDQAVVRVRDGGVGIHPEMLPRVFEMFRQADHTGGRSRGGLGIGLFIVRRLIEMHGGTVEARSTGLGQGAEFVVRIAAIEHFTVVAAQAATLDGPAPATRRRILVVDDNADAAESLATLLSLSGHETRVAFDGLEAIDTAASFLPDVVFLDIGMPALDGHETARRMRAQPWGKHLVLVALTGWGQTEDRRRSQDAGFNHHLVKPADPEMVSRLIASL